MVINKKLVGLLLLVFSIYAIIQLIFYWGNSIEDVGFNIIRNFLGFSFSIFIIWVIYLSFKSHFNKK